MFISESGTHPKVVENTEKLAKIMESFVKSAHEESQEMIKLTRQLRWLTIAMLGVVVVQIVLFLLR